MNEKQIAAIRAIRAGEKADGRTVNALKSRGWVNDDGAVTETGWEAFLDNVPTSKLTLLTLGEPLSRVPTAQRGTWANFPAGTRLTVVFAGRDRRGQQWFDCFADKRFGVIRVYRNSKHKIATTRVPKEDLHEAIV